MPEFLEKTFYNNTLYQWAISLLIVLGFVLIAKVVFWLFKKIVKKATEKTKTKLDDLLIDMIEEPVVVFIVLLGMVLAFQQLQFNDWLDDWLKKAMHVAFTINFTWLIARTVDTLIREYLAPMVAGSENQLDDQLLPLARKGIRTVIWTLGIVLALNNAGYNVGALLAGLGIGGIALAMAAKDTVANMFGGLTIFVDKPFTINDRIKIGGYDGTVEEIGIRSSRIRTLEGRLVTIPNHKFTESFVENVTSEPSRKVSMNIGLTYDTPPEKMERAIQILKNIQESDPGLEDKIWLVFNSFGDFSLGINFVYYITPGHDKTEVQTRVNLNILNRFNKEGLEFAFPTQTIFTVQND
ncbi:MAG TPA: mechanosensitive ion channel family protein [Bacteroidetes bacterium]|nr:mechanosensitive ion channel family protein [Bacteroidota bacterium]